MGLCDIISHRPPLWHAGPINGTPAPESGLPLRRESATTGGKVLVAAVHSPAPSRRGAAPLLACRSRTPGEATPQHLPSPFPTVSLCRHLARPLNRGLQC